MFMAQRNNNHLSLEKCEYDTFLVYPNFQASFDGHSGLYGAVMDYKSQFERLLDTMDEIRDWKSSAMLAYTLRRLKALARKAKSEEQRSKYEEMAKQLTPEGVYELARQLYKMNIDILERFAFALYDILSREDTKKNSASIVTPFFNKLSTPIAMELNLELEFESRLKTWKKIVQKMITKSETLDVDELENFNDIYGCRFVVSSSVSTADDYANAENECYKTLNVVIRHIEKLGGNLLPISSVGDASEQIWTEYRPFIKDYIANPKSNGYRALHACFEIAIQNKKIRFEVQVASCYMMHANELLAPHSTHDKNTKKELEFDPTKVRLRKFYASKREDGTILVSDRGEGLLVPKELSAHKWYHKH